MMVSIEPFTKWKKWPWRDIFVFCWSNSGWDWQFFYWTLLTY